jgi:hypothetical protein
LTSGACIASAIPAERGRDCLKTGEPDTAQDQEDKGPGYVRHQFANPVLSLNFAIAQQHRQNQAPNDQKKKKDQQRVESLRRHSLAGQNVVVKIAPEFHDIPPNPTGVRFNI